MYAISVRSHDILHSLMACKYSTQELCKHCQPFYRVHTMMMQMMTYVANGLMLAAMSLNVPTWALQLAAAPSHRTRSS